MENRGSVFVGRTLSERLSIVEDALEGLKNGIPYSPKILFAEIAQLPLNRNYVLDVRPRIFPKET